MILHTPIADERTMANAIRALAMDAVQAANSGHPGMPMGMADVASVLFNRFVTLDPTAPDWPNRDRFVLSAGHGSMLLYAIHHLLGYDDMGMDQLRAFRQLGSRTAGHPEYGHAKGIEMTTGPLGQGIATAVGMALSERLGHARFPGLIDHFTYVIAGDGCLMEGISQEALDLAGHLGLGHLIVLWDDNKITIDGDTDLATSTDQLARFAASGWHVLSCDGHTPTEIADAIEAARKDPRPSLIACRTVIGFGAPNKQGGHDVHGAPLGAEEIAAARAHLGWTHAPFEIPASVYAAWARVARRGTEARAAWEARLASAPDRHEFNALRGKDLTGFTAAMADYKQRLLSDKPKVATRKASEMALGVVNGTLPLMIGGSADLTGSNLTRTKGQTSVRPGDFTGDYLHYGVREHGMAAAMNGIALAGLFRPYGGTFLAFADYARPAIRLAALMGVPTVFVMTHDSIGLGEDGPTHQPVEILASLRAIPNLTVLRPADAVETAEAWEIAVAATDGPVLLALSRQNLPLLRAEAGENLTARGAYLLRDPGERQVTLIATGSEVDLAVKAAEALAAEGIRAAVVSAPSFEHFARQSDAYRAAVLGQAPRIGVEAAIRMGWDSLLRSTDAFVGMNGFGASAAAPALYEHFGITPQAVVETAKSLI
ncbi:transketolase [Pararhodobacter aggregans]|uniref:Transketolase n=1 Tax=Pararhodobacter aggregans TaxID=404875 RepID=A0A2T7UXG4_9RHOB|nr:transketolase [Pararhodobacter aggregans]PTX05017.1 transketolase [Pararhodobacter aggregans]PVE49334.1 transketolase [Pararhodobacter aggregans]